MASRNHYVVLGVAASESSDGIRAAFRELARQLHPDRTGPAGAHAFREVVGAYAVLRDPEHRRAYDQMLRSPPLERHLSLRSDSREVRPSREDIFDRFARNFSGRPPPKGERVEPLTVDVAVSEQEAAGGTTVRIGVPIFQPCAQCAARGCARCGGQGVTAADRSVAIGLPPMTGSGTTFVMPLDGVGVRNLCLLVRVRVDKATEPMGSTTRA
jgi:DnaJ-class molecular chaperone